MEQLYLPEPYSEPEVSAVDAKQTENKPNFFKAKHGNSGAFGYQPCYDPKYGFY